MKAAILEQLGTVPKFGDFAEPKLLDSEALIKVSAASIKPIDRAIALGKHYSSPKSLPVVCGIDGVGLDAAGQRVYFLCFRRPFGAMAEFAPAGWTVEVPDQLADAEAAALVNPALAAWLPLRWRGQFKPGDSVLIVGATGAAGRMAVRAARLLGTRRVVAAGRRTEVLSALGADATIDLRLDEASLRQAFADQFAEGIDIVVDYVWGRPIEILIEAIIRNDLNAGNSDRPIRLVSVGEMAGGDIRLPSSVLRGSRIEILGSGTANFPPVPEMQAIIREIFAQASAGHLQLDVEPMPLTSVSDAWRAAESSTIERPVLMIDS